MERRKKILLFTDWYEPGYKAGGPIRSCVNFVDHMRGDYQLYVFTSDRDLGALSPYPGIEIDVWQSKPMTDERVKVYYASPNMQSWSNIRRQWKEIDPDFVYLNSMFSAKFTIYPLIMARRNRLRGKIILSPRGMLRESALRFKPFKKKVFLSMFRSLGFHRDLQFHASDRTEADDIIRIFGKKTKWMMIANFPGKVSFLERTMEKKKGSLSMLFVGRIHPIKNLDYLLGVLKGVGERPLDTGDGAGIDLTVIGSCEDPPYWEKCKRQISELPSAIRVRYVGEIPNTEVPTLMAEHHIFVLPTRGENFGHAIFEALAMGKPVLISDQTPWRNLAPEGAGWDLPLDRPDLFVQAIREAAGWDREAYDEHCRRTRKYLEAAVSPSAIKSEYQKLFN